MRIRISLLMLLGAAALCGPARAANLDGSSRATGDAEAARLYAEASDYVQNMAEGQYSYAYLQFYWKRAQSNVDRARRVYPDSPTALALGRGELKLGPFEADYFKNRVLYNLELKRLGAFDDVNCAIFLYGRDEARSDARRDEALANILEVLARRQRWGEALRFPVLTAHRPILLRSIFRIAAFYGADPIAKQMMESTSPAEQQAAGFDALRAEGLALQGKPRADLFAFVRAHPDPAVREAALKGVVEREILFTRYERLRLPFNGAIQTVHLVAQNASLRDNVAEVAGTLFPGDADGAARALAVYHAALGAAPERDAPLEAHAAYLQYLADLARFDLLGSYAQEGGLPREVREGCALKAIELLAQAGQTEESEKERQAFAPAGSAGADDAALAQFRGRMDSVDVPLVARKRTFADLPISDPCVMATAIMEWSLTPNRSQRGETPWDPVVTRFAGGFENLPLPRSTVVGDAASTLKPY
jgi:hypothetical protein